MIRYKRFVLLVFGLLTLYRSVFSQSAYGEGELTHTSKSLLEMFLTDVSSRELSKRESIIVFDFKNQSSQDVDTLCVYDDEKSPYNLLEERYGVYRGFQIIMKGYPDSTFFKMAVDNELLKKVIRDDSVSNQNVLDSIRDRLYKGYIDFIPDSERHKIRNGIYNGYIVSAGSEYDPRLYYYVIYDEEFIINRIRSDRQLPNSYFGFPRKIDKK
ncbi:hypothetical protein [Sediminitomix flava]|uniref:Uncharacterized protein n=1 Tax=Sediminitomix flava TaxID=379075 RepID=A0A315YUY4_SEDFL|nr:hypothetical protein [Sediminitomix flava]PWJ32896.1 hypothetical protein BC781_1182 [Sediminitomix flava]